MSYLRSTKEETLTYDTNPTDVTTGVDGDPLDDTTVSPPHPDASTICVDPSADELATTVPRTSLKDESLSSAEESQGDPAVRTHDSSSA